MLKMKGRDMPMKRKKGRGKNFWKSMKSLEHLKDRIEKKFLNEERGCAECEKSSAFYFFCHNFLKTFLSGVNFSNTVQCWCGINVLLADSNEADCIPVLHCLRGDAFSF